jgi:hypothetical protein
MEKRAESLRTAAQHGGPATSSQVVLTSAAVSAQALERWAWVMPEEEARATTQLRELLRRTAERADELRFAMSPRGPSIVRFDLKPPFVHPVAAPGAADILAKLRESLGSPRQVWDSPMRWGLEQSFDTTYASWDLTPDARRWLVETTVLPDTWDQAAGMPEDPTLLREGKTILETITHEPMLVVTGTPEEIAELRAAAIDLERAD